MLKFYKLPPLILQTISWFPTRLALFIFTGFEVRGYENIKKIKGSVIFTPNHISELDPILVPAALSPFSGLLPMFYVSREKSFYNTRQILKRIFYGGFFFELFGAYQTHIGLNNYEVSLETHLKILRNGGSLTVFPEGDKSFDGSLREGKGGAMFLSHKTNTPIVPTAITGAYRTMFKDFILFRKKFIVTFGEPIYPRDIFGEKEVTDPHEYKVAMNKYVMPNIKSI